MKVSYAKGERHYRLIWKIGEQVNKIEFVGRGDLFNLIRALQKTGVTDFAATTILTTKMSFT